MKVYFELIASLANRGAFLADSHWPGELTSILDQLTRAIDEAYKNNTDRTPV